MRLPDKPSPGFLRKEAKDLLAALRETDPEASLAHAQRALAAAFGLGEVTSAASPVSFTPMGRCWSVTTDRGR